MSAENRIVSLSGVERLIERAAGGGPLETGPVARASDYAAGDRIADRYRLVRLIGKGGMGVVWEAHSEALDIRVALKLIHPTASNDEDQLRLLREAKAVARLSDPAVVRVFDCGATSNGEPYVVMELLEGQDLAARLDDRGRIPAVEAVRTLLPIVRALGTAHNAGIVHRDIKPENVFLTKSAAGEEQPKLLDFGIAKIELPSEKRLTQLGSALGSPSYMSPEQARGEDVDLRTDLWGICVVLYEAIAGQLPFDGDGYNAVMYAILSAEVKSFMDESVDEPDLWAIVARGLQRDRDLRWQTSFELGEALSLWLIERGILHDLSGVSLHATPKRPGPGPGSGPGDGEGQSSTLKSTRPAKGLEGPPREASPASVRALSQTMIGKIRRPPQPLRRRTAWILSALAVLSLLSVAVLGFVVWRIVNSGTNNRLVAVPALAPTFQPKPPSQTPVATAMRATPSVAPVGSVVAPPKPIAAEPKRSSKKLPSSTTGESFKNPFDQEHVQEHPQKQ